MLAASLFLPGISLLAPISAVAQVTGGGGHDWRGTAGTGTGEVVERIGEGEPELDRRLDDLLFRGGYLLIASDTLIARADTARGTVLVLGATLTLEGTVRGDLVEVAANVFVRPTARIDGDLVNIAGGLYPSDLARIRGATIDRPLAPYRLTRRDRSWIIEGIRREDRLVLDGFLGFHVPTYQRVDALGIRWGASYLFSPDTLAQTRLHGWVGYMSGRGALEGGTELGRRQGALTLALGAAEETATNDRWIRGDLRNSVSFFWDGDDYRNYYLVRRAYLRAQTELGSGERRLEFNLRGQLEEDRSLRTVNTWTLIGGNHARPNPPIDEGSIAGITLEVAGLWIGRKIALSGETSLETAGEVLGGDFAFNRSTLHGNFGMDAFANQVILLHWYFQGPVLGSAILPRQRWSILGGSGTLSAYGIGEFRGDRVAFVESRYVIPLPKRWALPLLGRPDLEIAYAIGNAWTEGMEDDLRQSIEARVRFPLLYIYVATDPARSSDHTRGGAGLSWRFGKRYPWRR